MLAKVAFYKAEKGNWWDKLVAWWTKSEYSHVELVVDGVWYSTSPRDGGVRAKRIKDKGNWDYVEVEVDGDWLLTVMAVTEGQKYDWLNILLTQVVPIGIQNDEKWICSEWVAYVLFKERLRLSPGGLWQKLN